jgi:hypothetical protein
LNPTAVAEGFESYMKVYLDSRDLINIFEHSKPCSHIEFIDKLTRGGYTLVLSLANVLEFSAPLVTSNSEKSSIMALLGRIEEAPLTYLSDSSITRLELAEAWRAYSQNVEYQSIQPFVNRFDYVLGEEVLKFSRLFLKFSLQEIVFTLWREVPSLFKKKQLQLANYLTNLVDADRSFIKSKKLSLQKNFFTAIGRKLITNDLHVPANKVEGLAKWIYKNPARCPSVRLGYEMYHQLVKNKQHVLTPSQVYDFFHVNAVPYVDICTLDPAMMTYVRQAIRRIHASYVNQLCKDTQEVMLRIETSGSANMN